MPHDVPSYLIQRKHEESNSDVLAKQDVEEEEVAEKPTKMPRREISPRSFGSQIADQK